MNDPYRELKKFRNSILEGNGSVEYWYEIADALKSSEVNHPNNLVFIIEDLEKIVGAEKSKEQICILDHGCGGGISVMYLAALGFKNIYGIDINIGKNMFLNDFFKNHLGFERNIFVEYKSDRLPFENNSIDYIFSQEVLEHVHPDVIDVYLKEEKRVLKKAGMARHAFPVRNSFHESHTKTLFLHWLFPTPIFNWVIGIFDKEKFDWLEKNLFLNWANFYEKKFASVFDAYSDQTARKLNFDFRSHEYDAARLTLTLRKLVRFFSQKRILKPFAQKLFSYFSEKEYLMVVEK